MNDDEYTVLEGEVINKCYIWNERINTVFFFWGGGEEIYENIFRKLHTLFCIHS